MGQLTLGKRPAKTRIGNYVQLATIPNKGFFFYINKLQYRMQHYSNYVQYKKKIFLSVQVKNKPCDGGSEHGFILGSMVWTVANSKGNGYSKQEFLPTAFLLTQKVTSFSQHLKRITHICMAYFVCIQ
jgi:hypothetical protein